MNDARTTSTRRVTGDQRGTKANLSVDVTTRDGRGREVSPTSALDGSYNGALGSFDSGRSNSTDEVEAPNDMGESRGIERTRSSDMELARSVSRQHIDRLLSEAVTMFHRDGPLVNPLERIPSANSMEMRMRFVCEAKKFEYGLFWEFEGKQSLLCTSKVCISDQAGVNLFVDTSFTMFNRFSMGFGMPGRIGYTGNYEWHEDVRQLPAWSFQRKRQAEQAKLRTVIGVPLENGVVEFGTRETAEHTVNTVQYIQKLCQIMKPASE